VKESCHINYIVTLTRPFEMEALEYGKAHAEHVVVVFISI